MKLHTIILAVLVSGFLSFGFEHPLQGEARDTHEHGVVTLPVSCNQEAQQAIETGLAQLHHMMYEQARPYFEAAAEADPECAMAHWGIAMTSFQPPWHPTSEEGLERGQVAVARAREIGPATEREEGYIAAAEAFFTDPEPPRESRALDHEARVEAWKTAQRELHEAYPEDVDAAAFYALAEVCYAQTQFSPDEERDYTRQLRAGALIEIYLQEHPEHPGLYHYLIHAYDSPALAPKAEGIAREYAELAPETVHAQHMASHIFVRLGLWEAETESARIDELVGTLRDREDDYWASMTEALGKAVDAWILYEGGETEQALALMSEASDLEDSMDKHPTTPGEVLPVRELYGELLLNEGRPEEAREAFEAALERTPNRRNALAGLEEARGL